MGRTLGELAETMSSAEFSTWLELYRREPWDDSRMDLGFGIVASTIANFAGRMRSETAPPARPGDFMPFVERSEEREPEIDPVAYFRAL